MRAAILSIGDELTLGQNIDTNSPWLAGKLAERSIMTIEQRSVADDRVAIAAAIADLAPRVGLLIITGGLGPTEDDLTREALGDVLTPGKPMVLDTTALAHIEQRFTKRGRTMPAMNRKQAMRPTAMRFLQNPNGTAPGLIGELNDCVVASLPGPPREMQPMFLEQVLPTLPSRGDLVLISGAVHQHGMGESDAAQRLGELMDRTRNPLVGITVSDSIVTAKVRAEGKAQSTQHSLQQTLATIEQLWQPYAFGRDGQTLADSLGQMLSQRRQTIATAESCTGGWLGKMIVDVAGSSDYYRGGWITYSDEMKQRELNVSISLLSKFGAVSGEVAAAMVEGALQNAEADLAVSITGIAGPARDDAPTMKQIGTVFIGLAQRRNDRVSSHVRRFLFPGDRFTVRDRSAKAALQMARLALLDQRDAPLLWEWVDAPAAQVVSAEAIQR